MRFDSVLCSFIEITLAALGEVGVVKLCRPNVACFRLIFFWPRTFCLNFLICANVEVNLLFHPLHALFVLSLYPSPNNINCILQRLDKS